MTPKARRLAERQEPAKPLPDPIETMAVDPDFDSMDADREFAEWRWPNGRNGNVENR